MCCSVFFFQAEDGIRDLVRSRGLGDVYKRQEFSIEFIDINFDGNLDLKLYDFASADGQNFAFKYWLYNNETGKFIYNENYSCLLYTSDAADERSSVDLGGRRIIKKKTKIKQTKKTHNINTTNILDVKTTYITM